jgi:hypothetical protein
MNYSSFSTFTSFMARCRSLSGTARSMRAGPSCTRPCWEIPSLVGLSSEDIDNVGLEMELLLKSIFNHIMKIPDQQLVHQASQVQALTPNVTGINTIMPVVLYVDQPYPKNRRIVLISSGW